MCRVGRKTLTQSISLYIICTKSVCGQYTACKCQLRFEQATSTIGTLTPRGRFSSSRVPDSDWIGLADPPEDWPAANSRDATTTTPRKLQSCKARVWLVVIITTFCRPMLGGANLCLG